MIQPQQQGAFDTWFQNLLAKGRMMIATIFTLFIIGGIFYLSFVVPIKAIIWFKLPESRRNHPISIFLPAGFLGCLFFLSYGLTLMAPFAYYLCDSTTAEPLPEDWWRCGGWGVAVIYVIIGPIFSLCSIILECAKCVRPLDVSAVSEVLDNHHEPMEVIEPPKLRKSFDTSSRRILRDGDSLN